MIDATLTNINSEIIKYQLLTQDMGDTQIIPSSNNDKNKIVSDEILFEDENAHLYLTFNPTIKKIHCVIYLTEIDNAFVEKILSHVGLPTTEENIQNYQRDPTLIERFWNDRFIAKYTELMKYLRKSKMPFQLQEKFKPAFNKNRNNEIVDNFG